MAGSSRSDKVLAEVARLRGLLDEVAGREEDEEPDEEDDDPPDEARLRRQLGETLLDAFQYEEAERELGRALAMARDDGDVSLAADCILGLARVALARSDHAAARARFQQARALYHHEPDEMGEAECIEGLGDVALARSDHEAATALYEEALSLYRKVDSKHGEAQCIQSLGDAALARSDRESARARYEHALRLYEGLPGPYWIGLAHEKLAEVAPDPEARRAHRDAARAVWQSIGRADLVASLDREPT